MKNKLLLLMMLALPTISISQTKEDSLRKVKKAEADSIFQKFIKVNFAVPDLPAFNVLGNSPSDILRPTDVKALSILTSEFYNGSSIIVPKSFALELSPFLLAKNNSLTLHDYQQNQFWYNLRLSLGTNTSTVNNQKYSNLAIGARITIIDKGDLKNDEVYIDLLKNSLALEVDIENKAKEQFLKDKNKTIQEVAMDEALNKEMEQYIDKAKKKKLEDEKLLSTYIKDIPKFKEDYKKNNWNKEKLEFAYAYLGASPDSLIKNIQTKKHAAWGTWAVPVKKWGQLLVGINYSYMYADSLNKQTDKTVNYEYNTFSASSRLYFGSNRVKGFIEGQYKFISLNDKRDAFLNTGGEFNIRDGIWLVVNAGINWHDLGSANSKSGFYSSLNLRFTLPENFKMN
ncbi:MULTISPECIES: hypothetical protein [unclassified Arcicella]|uniref:hypothetical protein n=1 Tax=unclassified Arcicella TaxID=2644986 RepID=UPI002857624E|nr:MULTISPECIES: hypothetical protein [unclassified Arcicella]MDR6564643.1 hypothetical protein [Arcicella sp. BE51]MDR6814429.1 hypothetical protein [Arcicella sp. BE140]MDR6825815.1 hypothetical protein [Arcicella sp. BE139]